MKTFFQISDSYNGIENIDETMLTDIYYTLQIYNPKELTVYLPDGVWRDGKNFIYNPKNPSGKNPIDIAQERFKKLLEEDKEGVYGGNIDILYFLLELYGYDGNKDIVMQIMNLEESNLLKQAIYKLCRHTVEIQQNQITFDNFDKYYDLCNGDKLAPIERINCNPFCLKESYSGETIPNYEQFCDQFTGDILNRIILKIENHFMSIQKDKDCLNDVVGYEDFKKYNKLRKIHPSERYLWLITAKHGVYIKFNCEYKEINDYEEGTYQTVDYNIFSAKITEKSKEDLKLFLKQCGFNYEKTYHDYMTFLDNISMIKRIYKKLIIGEKTSRDYVNTVSIDWLLQVFVPSPVKPKQFLNHTHIVGRSGSGKSELLKTIIKQVGKSCILLDPHGDIADSLDKKQNFFKIAPTESRFVINPFDIEDKSIDNRELVSEEIIQLLQEIIQDSNVSVLMKTISFPIISTLLKLPYADFRMFADCINPISGLDYLERLTPLVDDHHKRLWEDLKTDAYDSTKRSIFNRLQSFLNKHKIISTVCGYDDFNSAIKRVEQGENLVISLPIPQLGEDVSEVLGRFFMCRMQIWAKRRQTLAEKDRKPVLLIVDECQNYLSEETARTLDQFGRKFGLYMVLAHQHIAQIDGKGLKGSIMANCKNKIIGYCDESTAKPMGNAMGVDYEEFTELKKGHWWGLFEDQKPLKFYARLAKFKTVGEAVNYAESQNTDFVDGWGLVQEEMRNTTKTTPKTPKFTAKFDL